MDTVNVPLQRAVFERLQRLATPLVDDVTTVVERLLIHWEKTAAKGTGATTTSGHAQFWRSSRGESFPIGTSLRGTYLGKAYHAKITSQGIEFNGKHYANPSAASIAVKRHAGARGRAASTNGWDFWEMLEPQGRLWMPISTIRSKPL